MRISTLAKKELEMDKKYEIENMKNRGCWVRRLGTRGDDKN